jgi:hypothetical protein
MGANHEWIPAARITFRQAVEKAWETLSAEEELLGNT